MPAYQTAGFAYQGAGQLAYQGDSGPAPYDPTGATAGYLRRGAAEYIRRAEDARREAEARDAAQANRAEPTKINRSELTESAYTARSANLVKAIRRFEAEATELRGKIAAAQELERTEMAAKARAAAERQILLHRQALLLAETQRAIFAEEMEVLDIAYFAVMAVALRVH